MDLWVDIQLHKWIYAGWAVVYVISLFLMFKNRNSWGINVKKVIVLIALSVLLFFCPLTVKLVYGRMLPGFAEYERLSWLFFVVPVISYTFVKVIYGLKKRQRIKGIIAFITFCFILSESPFFTRYYKGIENNNKVPDYVIEIGDAITEDGGCYDGTLYGVRQVAKDDKGNWIKPKVLFQLDEQYNIHFGDDLRYGIRQYASALVLSEVVIPESTYNSSSFNLAEYANLLNYEYFVCSDNEYLRNQAEECGFELLKEVDDYVVYRNGKEVTLYFVRHGETDANVKKVFAGSGTDAKLTEEGKRKTRITGKALKNTIFDAAYVSSLSRTGSTAKIILDENNNSVPLVRKDSKLNDISWGDIEGLTQEEILEKFPDFSDDKYLGTVGDTRFVSPINATTKATIVNTYLNELYSIIKGAPNEGNVLIVGHSAFDWLLRLEFPEETANSQSLDNSSISVIKYNKGRWILEKYNVDPTEFKEIEQ